eukprot:s750_g42.t1
MASGSTSERAEELLWSLGVGENLPKWLKESRKRATMPVLNEKKAQIAGGLPTEAIPAVTDSAGQQQQDNGPEKVCLLHGPLRGPSGPCVPAMSLKACQHDGRDVKAEEENVRGPSGAVISWNEVAKTLRGRLSNAHVQRLGVYFGLKGLKGKIRQNLYVERLGLLVTASPERRLRIAFGLLDVGGDGVIGRRDVFAALAATRFEAPGDGHGTGGEMVKKWWIKW